MIQDQAEIPLVIEHPYRQYVGSRADKKITNYSSSRKTKPCEYYLITTMNYSNFTHCSGVRLAWNNLQSLESIRRRGTELNAAVKLAVMSVCVAVK